MLREKKLEYATLGRCYGVADDDGEKTHRDVKFRCLGFKIDILSYPNL